MTADHIDHAGAERAIAAGVIRSAVVTARGRTWSVLLHFGRRSPALTAKSGQVRTWSKLDTLTAYLKGLGLHSFEVDASGYDPTATKARTDAASSARMRHVHTAAAHDRWFREQVAIGLREADNPETQWVPQEAVTADYLKRKAKYQRMAAQQQQKKRRSA